MNRGVNNAEKALADAEEILRRQQQGTGSLAYAGPPAMSPPMPNFRGGLQMPPISRELPPPQWQQAPMSARSNTYMPMGPTGYPVPRPSRAEGAPRRRSPTRVKQPPVFEVYRICEMCGYDDNGSHFGWCWNCRHEFCPGALERAARKRSQSPSRAAPSGYNSAPPRPRAAELYSTMEINWEDPPEFVLEMWEDERHPYLPLVLPHRPPPWLHKLWLDVDSQRLCNIVKVFVKLIASFVWFL